MGAELVQFQAENADSLPGQAMQTYSSSASMESRRIEISSQLHRLESELANSRRQIAADRPFALYADGDPIGELPVRVRAARGAIRVLVPVAGEQPAFSAQTER